VARGAPQKNDDIPAPEVTGERGPSKIYVGPTQGKTYKRYLQRNYVSLVDWRGRTDLGVQGRGKAETKRKRRKPEIWGLKWEQEGLS